MMTILPFIFEVYQNDNPTKIIVFNGLLTTDFFFVQILYKDNMF